MKSNLLRGAALLVVAQGLMSTVGLAQAQTNDTSQNAAEAADELGIGDIVVTAQRRTERSQDVGIAIAAFSGDTLKAQGVTSSLDIAKFTPGITASGTFGGQGMQFSIRGVTQSDYNDAIEAPIAVYVDDVYIAPQQGQGLALFDIQRVEALKGPQGTLFGRNATGGLVHFVVNTPQFDGFHGGLDVTYGRYQRTILDGFINAPLGENLAMRLSGYWNRRDSSVKNLFPAGMAPGAPLNFGPQGVSPTGQDIGNEDNLAGRVQLAWRASDQWSFRLSGSALRQDLSESPWTSSAQVPVVDAQGRMVNEIRASPTETRAAIDQNGANYFNPAVFPFMGFLFSPNNDGRRAPGATWNGYVPMPWNHGHVSKDFALSQLNTFRAYNVSLHAEGDLGWAQLAAVSAYSRYKKNFMLDADASPVNVFTFATKADTDSFSQEIRLSGEAPGISWQAGVFYLDIDAAVESGPQAPRGSALALVFGFPITGLDPLEGFRLKTKSASVFGQLSWEMAPKFTLVLGGRLINERQRYTYDSFARANVNDYAIDNGPALFPLLPSFRDKRSNWLWAGKAQVEYRPDRSLLLYAGVNRGVKGGSYNAQTHDGSPPLAPSDIPYKPETLVSLEGGAKVTGQFYTLNAAVFHYFYDDYQSFIFQNISGLVTNEKARTTGGEIEGTLRFGGLNLSARGAIINAKVKGLQVAPGVPRDTRPTYSPKYQAGGNVSYTIQDVGGGDLTMGAVYSYQSSFYHNARNFDGQRFAGRSLVDVNLDWKLAGGLHFGGFVKNLFNKEYKQVGLDLTVACGCNIESYGEARTWGIVAGYKF